MKLITWNIQWARGIDLRKDLSAAEVAAVRAAWLKHQVVAFPDQPMKITDIERFATYMGANGEDPSQAAY